MPAGIPTKVIEEMAVDATGFRSVDELRDAVDRELTMLKGLLQQARNHQNGTGDAIDQWFGAWVRRLEDWIEQHDNWKRQLNQPSRSGLKDELRSEMKILSGCIGLMDTALMSEISSDEDEFLVRIYRQDFRRTRRNIVNALNTPGL